MKKVVVLCTALGIAVSAAGASAAPKERGAPPSPNEHANVACENTQDKPHQPRFCTARSATITSSGLSDAQGDELAGALGVSGAFAAGQSSVGEDGVFRYIDPDRFQGLDDELLLSAPASLPAGQEQEETVGAIGMLNLPALAARLQRGEPAVEVPTESEARDFVSAALAKSGATPAEAVMSVVHSGMDMAPNPASAVPPLPGLDEAQTILLDTQVSYQPMLGGLPVRGPGSNVSVTLAKADDGLLVTQAQYAARGLSLEEAPRRQIMAPEAGPDLCRARLGLASGAPVDAQLVYYAPPLSQDVAALLPHFECTAPATADAGAPLGVFVPAVLDGPRARITEVTVEGERVAATGAVEGGKAPFTFAWTSAATSAAEQPPAGESTSYRLVTRQPTTADTLLLTVTDADGLVSIARESVSLGAPTASGTGEPPANSHALSGIDVGAEGGTFSPDCSPYTKGWADWNSSSGTPVQFHYNADWAWSTDFISDTMSPGNDHNYADDVDMIFYCGHGWPGGFTFENTSGPTDKDLRTTEARWGDRDLEWIALLSCQVLSHTSSNPVWRWAGAFQGLHQMLGFHTNAYATGNPGSALALNMHGYSSWISPKKIFESWVQTVKDEQPSGVVWRTLMPVSTSGAWNRHDYFHGEGSVTPDIPASSISYFISHYGTV